VSADALKYTERERVVFERAAYDRAVTDVFHAARDLGGIERVDARKWAAKSFPLPKITLPRVVPDPHHPNVIWRVDGAELKWLDAIVGASWWSKPAFHPTPERVELWASLLASPTEETEDDAPGLSGDHGHA